MRWGPTAPGRPCRSLRDGRACGTPAPPAACARPLSSAAPTHPSPSRPPRPPPHLLMCLRSRERMVMDPASFMTLRPSTPMTTVTRWSPSSLSSRTLNRDDWNWPAMAASRCGAGRCRACLPLLLRRERSAQPPAGGGRPARAVRAPLACRCAPCERAPPCEVAGRPRGLHGVRERARPFIPSAFMHAAGCGQAGRSGTSRSRGPPTAAAVERVPLDLAPRPFRWVAERLGCWPDEPGREDVGLC